MLFVANFKEIETNVSVPEKESQMEKIKIKRKEVSQVNAFGKTISKIYAGGKLV